MVRQYARRRVRDPERVRALLDRIRSEGREEFDIYDVEREQEELRAETSVPGHTRTGRHRFTRREIAALLHSKQVELGIEPAGYRHATFSPDYSEGRVRMWRFGRPSPG